MDAVTVDAIAKLFEVVLGGMGGLSIAKQILEPWQTKRMAYAEVEKKKILAQGEIDVMKIGIDNRRAVEAYEASPPLLARAENPVDMKVLLEPTFDLAEVVEHKAQQQQARRLGNVQKVAAVAAAELEGQDASAEPVDDAWTSRFFDAAKDVSQEQMQHLWGKILAGEVRAPGSFSMRSIDIVRCISKQEARMFQGIASLVIEGAYVFNDPKIHGSDSSSLLQQAIVLAEAGLLVANTSLLFNESVGPKEFVRLKMSTMEIRMGSDVARQLSVGTYVLSAVGREIFNILNQPADEGYARKVVDYLRSNGYVVYALPGVRQSNGKFVPSSDVDMFPLAEADPTKG